MFSCDSQWLLGYVDRVSVIFMLISIYNGSCMGVIIGMLLAFYIYNIFFVFFYHQHRRLPYFVLYIYMYIHVVITAKIQEMHVLGYY